MAQANTKYIPYYHTDHGVEILPQRLELTREERRWRKDTSSFLWERNRSLNALSQISNNTLKELRTPYHTSSSVTSKDKKNTLRELREQLNATLQILRIVNEILKVQYDSPDWGNQPHIIDELVFILLTRRSKIEDAIRQLKIIRETYTTWVEVAHTLPDKLKTLIMGGGLEDAKVKYIQESLQRILQKFGRIDENDFVGISNEQLYEFLLELPGVGPKSSACILMYARNADIFPADTHCIRVLNRLGFFKKFGFEWDQANHKQAEKDLLQLIPPHIRSDLHRNLLALGRELCKQDKPLCEQCELRKFCNHYRQQQQDRHATDRDAYIAIDMFCGAGGFSLGLRRAGFKVIAAVDNSPDAIRTYRLNHPDMPDDAVIEGDVRDIGLVEKLCRLLNGRDLDLLVGGPPCQGFSMMGNRVPHKFENGNKKFGTHYNFAEDERNHLFEAMIEIAKELNPRYVVIENVPGLGSAEIEEKSYAEHIAEMLGACKYRTEVIRLEAVNLGIPQKRHRYFIVGIYETEQRPNLEALLKENETTTLEHALYDLPELSASDGNWIARHTNGLAQDVELYSQYLDRFDIRGNTRVLFSHVSRFHNADDLELYSNLGQGETYQQLVERLIKERGEKPSFTKYATKNFKDKYYRLEWCGPSKTIVSHLHKDGNSFVHPRQTRSISVREAARIQSFPDNYIFCGSRGSQFIQIGNAVPPIMAEAIGQVLIKSLIGQQNENENE